MKTMSFLFKSTFLVSISLVVALGHRTEGISARASIFTHVENMFESSVAVLGHRLERDAFLIARDARNFTLL